MEKTFDLHQIDAVAKEILAADPYPVILFNGQMGAGKTTFIKALCKALGVVDGVSSPTFSLINEYRTSEGEAVYHFDAYRLKTESEAYAIGMDEYLESGNRCFVEWAEKIPGLLPDNCSTIDLTISPDGSRKIVLT